MPVKEITSACHCAIVIPTERSDEGSLFHKYCKYFADPHLFATEPIFGLSVAFTKKKSADPRHTPPGSPQAIVHYEIACACSAHYQRVLYLTRSLSEVVIQRRLS